MEVENKIDQSPVVSDGAGSENSSKLAVPSVVDPNNPDNLPEGQSTVKNKALNEEDASASSSNKWYILNVIPGRENKVVTTIRHETNKSGLSSMISDIVTPTEFAPGVKSGQRVAVEKKILPGYIIIKMTLNDAAETLIRGISGVLGFVGNGRKPQSVPESQIKHLLEIAADSKNKCDVDNYVYSVGDMIKVIDGPFDGFSAIISEIDNERKVAEVSVSIFGRETSMSLGFDQMHRIVD